MKDLKLMLKSIPWYKWLWELPQNLIGLFMIVFYWVRGDVKFTSYSNAIIVRSEHFTYGGCSLGRFIFLNKYTFSPKVVAHEYGHCIQSTYLGWLYLVFIGVPSGVHAIIHHALYGPDKKRNKNYYHFYTEKWADELAGVIRLL